MFFRAFNFPALLLILLFALLFAVVAYSQEFGRGPLKKCWTVDAEPVVLSGTAFATDRSTIYMPLQDGSVKAVSAADGKIIWKAELGGDLVSKLLLDEDSLYVVQKTADSEVVKYKLRRLSLTTGITLWQIDLDLGADPREVALALTQSTIVGLTELGTLFSVEKADGTGLRAENLGFLPSSSPVLAGDRVYFGVKEKGLFQYSLLEKQIKQAFDQPFESSFLLRENGRMVVGDRVGGITLLDLTTGSRLWRARVGGEIMSIERINRGFIVLSSDNFIYLISETNGKRIWKRRLAGRIAGQSDAGRGITVVVALNDDFAGIIETGKGKLVNQMILGEDETFISKPIILGDEIIFSTNKGISAYRQDGCEKQ